MRKSLLLAAATFAALTNMAHAQSQPYIGQIMIFGGNFCPVGWMAMNGQVLPIGQYVPLFSVLGIAYGGNGRTNFAIPKAATIADANGHAYMQCIAYQGVFPPRS